MRGNRERLISERAANRLTLSSRLSPHSPHTSPPKMSKLDLKVTHNGLTRKLSVHDPLKWSDVRSAVQSRFRIRHRAEFILTYTDEDGDTIVVVSPLASISSDGAGWLGSRVTRVELDSG